MKPYPPLPFPPASLWEISDPGFKPETLDETVLVKETHDRKVFRAGGFYIKAFRLNHIRRIFDDPSRKEYDIAQRLDKFKLTASPAAFCKHGGWSYFAARAVKGPDLETFLKRHWPRLDKGSAHEIIKDFAVFINDIAEAGVFQPDFHLNNVLFDIDNKRFVLIDLHRATVKKRPLSEEEFGRQLSFILPPLMDTVSSNSILSGAVKLSEKWDVIKTSSDRFKICEHAFSNMKRYWSKRGWRKTCRKFSIFKKNKSLNFINRGADGNNLINIAETFRSEPGRFIKQNSCRLLKDSRHTLCIDAEISGIHYFIKGYRSSGHLKSISYILRQSRVEHAWNMSWQLNMRGVSTPLPLYATYSGNPWNSIYGLIIYPWIDEISESRERAAIFMADHRERQFFLKEVAFFLWNMHERGIYHGDCKITNFSIREDSSPFFTVFDLDSAEIRKDVSQKERLRDITAMSVSLQKLYYGKDPVHELLLDNYAKLHLPWQEERKSLLNNLDGMIERKSIKQAARV